MNKKVFARLIAMLTKVKPLHPLLEPYLWDNMVPLFCKKNTPLHEQDDVVDKAYFIGRGYILIYYIEDGKKHVLRICGADEIIAGKSFMSGVESRYYVSAVKDTYLIAVTAGQMKVAYDTIPETEELARLVLSSFEEKELKRDEMIRKGGEESVLHFYTIHPDLLQLQQKLKQNMTEINDNTTDWKALYEQALITIANLEQLTREMAKAYDGVKEEYFKLAEGD